MSGKITNTDLLAQITYIKNLHNKQIENLNLMHQNRINTANKKKSDIENLKNINATYKTQCILLRNDVLTNYLKYYKNDTQFRNYISSAEANIWNIPFTRDIYNRYFVYMNFYLSPSADDYKAYQQWYKDSGKTEDDEDQFTSILGHPKENPAAANTLRGHYNANNWASKWNYIKAFCTSMLPYYDVIEQPVYAQTRKTYKPRQNDSTEDSVNKPSTVTYNFDKSKYPYTNITTGQMYLYTNLQKAENWRKAALDKISSNFKNQILTFMNNSKSYMHFKYYKDQYTYKTYYPAYKNNLITIKTYQKSNKTNIIARVEKINTHFATIYFNGTDIWKQLIRMAYVNYVKTFPPVSAENKTGYGENFNNKELFNYDAYFEI